jgi:hypothetical protein
VRRPYRRCRARGNPVDDFLLQHHVQIVDVFMRRGDVNSSGVEMLYGRLPITRSRAAARRDKRAKSKSSASASCSSKPCGAPQRARSRCARSRSISIASSVRALPSSSSVSAPRPGPISSSAWSARRDLRARCVRAR